ncbi:helix-turn-helix transcriptional regulator [Massilia putida]|uniref:helix-turn-helix transcriptional regulator n=1 Tax=Massilia putida TaxID=1141883 RepID=UPI000952BC34|nr:AraC family transcriptional regulator [Massilia putida]
MDVSALHVRSYGADLGADRHDYAQLVLPLGGTVLLDIEGRQDRLDLLRGACVAPGAWHAQRAEGPNESLILDVGAGAMSHPAWARLLERPFMTLGPGARKLIEFMGMMRAQPALLGGWVPLLLDTLALDAPRPASRLAALLARVDAEPGLAWTTETMARSAGLSVSRLHALFRTELDTSPHAWLRDIRLSRARAWLTETARPIADIALAAGFSDQSPLTRALRDATGLTPGAYRRARSGGVRPAPPWQPPPASGHRNTDR